MNQREAFEQGLALGKMITKAEDKLKQATENQTDDEGEAIDVVVGIKEVIRHNRRMLGSANDIPRLYQERDVEDEHWDKNPHILKELLEKTLDN